LWHISECNGLSEKKNYVDTFIQSDFEMRKTIEAIKLTVG